MARLITVIGPIIGLPTAIYDYAFPGMVIFAYGLSSSVTSIYLLPYIN